MRDVADAHVERLARLDPLVAGVPAGQDQLPDLSPDGRAALDDLSHATLAALDHVERTRRGPLLDVERRCGRLLRERLEADLLVSVDDEYLREIVNGVGLQRRVRGVFLMMPTGCAEDWAVVAKRMRQVPKALAGHRESLTTALDKGRFVAAPAQVRIVAHQLDDWLREGDGRGWYAGFCAGADVPGPLRSELDRAAGLAAAATAELRDWLCTNYLPKVALAPEGVGADRYRTWARFWTGATLDPHETYAWGWEEYRRIRAEAHRSRPHRHVPPARWKTAADHLSTYQTGPGSVAACTEGWASYAERLMAERRCFRTPDDRRGHLERQLLRAVRVVTDIGTHLTLTLPEDAPVGAGKLWTPALAKRFLTHHSGQSPNSADGEIGRHLGRPGRAITHKLGEQAWLDGREAARNAYAARGKQLDLESWHAAALSLGSLGLDDLRDELAQL